MKIEKTEVQDLYKTDPGTFVYDIPKSSAAEYKRRRKEMEEKDQEMNAMKAKINNMDKDLNDIKGLLQILVQKADK